MMVDGGVVVKGHLSVNLACAEGSVDSRVTVEKKKKSSLYINIPGCHQV